MSRKTIGAALAVAALALAGTASADTADKSHGSHDRTIRLVEAHKDLQPTFVDTGKPGPSVGDLAVARDEVLREDGSPAGTFRQVCTLTDLVGSPFTSTFECTGSIALKDGTIAMEGPFTPSQRRERRRDHRRHRPLQHRARRDRRPRRGRPDHRQARRAERIGSGRAHHARPPGCRYRSDGARSDRTAQPPGAQRRAAVRRRLARHAARPRCSRTRPRSTTAGLAVVVAGSASLAARAGRGRRAASTTPATRSCSASAPLLISLAAFSNGERSGGAAGYDELYYLWVVFYAAYYLRRRTPGAAGPADRRRPTASPSS